jgi:uncharacterized protein YndB with AHSA1/START domain
MSGTTLLPIVAEIGVAAPIEHLWATMVGGAGVSVWLGALNYREVAGSTFHMQLDAARHAAGDITGAVHCDVLLQQRPYRFNFSWYLPGTPYTLVAMTLLAEDAGCSHVHVIHGGWGQYEAAAVQARYERIDALWTERLLPRLKQTAERTR